MDQQITAVIVNRKEYKLKVSRFSLLAILICMNVWIIFHRFGSWTLIFLFSILQKGCGYHLDLFILSILIAICSFFGLPWFVAATVLSMTHVNSLKMESESAAPGEKPQFYGVREQRVTHICIFILCGLSIFMTRVLRLIPMPVLYGVFLYMGTSSLKGSQVSDWWSKNQYSFWLCYFSSCRCSSEYWSSSCHKSISQIICSYGTCQLQEFIFSLQSNWSVLHSFGQLSLTIEHQYSFHSWYVLVVLFSSVFV